MIKKNKKVKINIKIELKKKKYKGNRHEIKIYQTNNNKGNKISKF